MRENAMNSEEKLGQGPEADYLNNIVEEARKKAEENPDLVFYRWSGHMFGEEDRFSRLDKTYLHCVYMDRKPKYRKIPGYVERYDNLERIVYTSDTVFQIKPPSKRKGRIMPAQDVWEGENAVPAGLNKALYINREMDQFHMYRMEDRLAARNMRGLVEDEVGTTDGPEYPDVFLSCPDNRVDIHLRPSEEALTWLRSFEEYDPSENPDVNLRNLVDLVGIYAGRDKRGNTRSAFPFRYVYGRGVKVMRWGLDTSWDSCSFDLFSREESQISFRFRR